MAVVIETSPALVSSTSTTALTTASFTAPAGSVLFACAFIASDVVLSNNGAALTWTSRKADTTDSIWTAPVAEERAGLTVTGARIGGGGFQGALAVYVVTGADLGSPVGITGNGTSTSSNITPTAYTSTVDGSRGLCATRDTVAQGTPTSSDDEQAWLGLTNKAAMSILKAANTATASTAVTFNMDAFDPSEAAWDWIAVEIVPVLPPVPLRVWTPPTAVHRASSW